MPATMVAHLTIREGGEKRFEEVVRAIHEASHRLEDGLVRYEYVRTATPRKYYCFLSFVDEAAFLVHQASDHHEDHAAELRSLIEDGTFEWVDPVAGASDLGPTDGGPLPEGAGEVEAAYHKAMGVAVQDWWLPLREG